MRVGSHSLGEFPLNVVRIECGAARRPTADCAKALSAHEGRSCRRQDPGAGPRQPSAIRERPAPSMMLRPVPWDAGRSG